MTKYIIVIGSLFFFAAPAYADVAGLSFTNDPRIVDAGAVSDVLTVQAQDGSGQGAALPQTGCLSLESSSGSGQFSSSATNWSAVLALSMNKSSMNRGFYYKDTTSGAHTLTVKLALRPETVTQTCTAWPIGEWSILGTAVQTITVGSGQTNTNAQTQATSTDTSSNTTGTQTSTASAPVSSYVPPPVPHVFADAGGDRTVIVGADTQFNGRAYNRQKENVEHVRFLWNFGDGATADGPAATHHYDYPGRYAVVLTIADNLDAVSDRVVVTAEPAKLAFSVFADGGIAIENRAGRDLDLSRWIVRSFGQLFALPEHSIILNGETMRISQKTLKFWSGPQTELDYPNGVLALHANESFATGVSAAPVLAPASQAVQPAVPVARTRVAPVADRAPEAAVPEDAVIDSTPTVSPEAQTAAAAASVSPGSTYWWLGALAFAALAGGTVLAVRRIRAGEWDITEDA